MKKEKNFLKKEINDAIVDAKQEAKNTISSSTSFIISALTLVAGLAWNDVAKNVFDKLKEKFSGWGEIVGSVIYALVVTILVVFLISRLKKVKSIVGGESIK